MLIVSIRLLHERAAYCRYEYIREKTVLAIIGWRQAY